MIVTFLAMLEMIRLKLVRVFQSGAMGPIRVYKRARPADAPKPLLDPEERHAARPRPTTGDDADGRATEFRTGTRSTPCPSI